MSLGTILIIILILILLGVIPTWGHSRAWGYGPSGIVGLILIIVGIIGLVFSLFWMITWSPRRRADRVVERDRYREPPAY